MKFSAWYTIIVGALIIGQWGFFLALGAVPELHTEPVRLAFHLAAEFTTAVMLIIAGTALFRGFLWAGKLALIASGMLVYTLITSPGYFAQLGEWPLAAIFVLLLALDAINIRTLIHLR